MSGGVPGGIGSPLRRREDPRLITGEGQYVDDLTRDGMLFAAFVRSPEAHARVDSVDASEALATSGVVGVYTAADLGLEAPMPNPHPHPLVEKSRQAPPLAFDEVCYVGQAVAVVVAESRYLAADAAELVWVDYESLPAVTDLATAHTEGGVTAHLDSDTNVVARLETGCGDIAAAFADAEVTFPLELHQHRGACVSMETRGVVAENVGEQLTLWTSSQNPFGVARMLKRYLGRDDIRVIAPDVGGGFGPKGGVYAEEYVLATLATRLERPVKWIESRREHFVATQQQRDMIAHLEVAADASGKLLGLRARLVHDNGAFVPYGLLLPMTGFDLIQGAYHLPALEMSLDVVYTNAVPTSPIRGAARPNATFISERVMDAIARHTGIDRVEVRKRNFIAAHEFPYEYALPARYGGNITYDSGAYHASLDAVLTLADATSFEQRRSEAAEMGRVIGFGVASYVEDTGLAFEEVRVGLESDGSVTVTVGTGSQGQGHTTVYSQICATLLSVDPESVTVRNADTDLTGNGVATVASRTAVTAGSSTHVAAEALARRLREIAADHLEAAVADIVLEGAAAKVAGSPGSEVSFADLYSVAAKRGDELVEDGAVRMDRPPYAFGSHVAEVEVDRLTGHVQVVGYWVAHDCGTVLNPMIVDGQIDGGVVHGLSNALLERVSFSDDGQPLTTTFMDFRIPTAVEVPPIVKVHTETPAPGNPLGVKGAGEGGTIPAAAAIASAVDDALAHLGVVTDRYPLTPDVVWQMINEASSG